MKLREDYYVKDDVVKLAKTFLGKIIYTRKNKIVTAGIITETEAYNGITDRASHAFGNRRTARTEVMYAKGGTAYVYFCYGIHSLFNIVTNKEGIPHAVLVRSIYPVLGMAEIKKRRNNFRLAVSKLCIGPGNVSQGLGIHYTDTGKSLLGNEIWLEESDVIIPARSVVIGPRIGVAYAGKDAELPYRFRIMHDDMLKQNNILSDENGAF